jgi:hypothetical protein
MADEAVAVQHLSFKLNPLGQDVTVFLKCSGIATGTYSIQFGIPGQSDQARTGNIESPERHHFPAGSELSQVMVKVKSVPFLASEPGGYQITIEQPGGERLETPVMPYSTEVEITITGTPAGAGATPAKS